MSDFTETTRRSVAWVKRALDSDILEVKPPYQRNPVWLDPQKSSLIDTILHGYPVPELYMQDIIDSAGNERHFVVDGQQRIRACMEFVEGQFELDANESPSHAEMTFEDLSDEDKKKVWGYPFIVRLMPDVPEDEMRDIFKRINRYNMALNKQELRHATYWGEFISSMEGLAEHEYWVTSGVFSANDFRRMLDVEFISELAIAVLQGPQNKKASLDRWYKAYEQEFEDRSNIEQTFETVIAELSSVLPDIKATRWRRTSDFYTLFTTFAAHEDELPLSQAGRASARDKLLTFSTEVSAALTSDPPKHVKVSARAKRYARNVERAASDLARRQQRTKELEGLLAGVWVA
jgi:hypothetical protein